MTGPWAGAPPGDAPAPDPEDRGPTDESRHRQVAGSSASRVTRATVYAERDCGRCGASFAPASGRQRYCAHCRTPKLARERNLDAQHRHRSRERGQAPIDDTAGDWLTGPNGDRVLGRLPAETRSGMSVSALRGVVASELWHEAAAGGFVWVRRSDGEPARFYSPAGRFGMSDPVAIGDPSSWCACDGCRFKPDHPEWQGRSV